MLASVMIQSPMHHRRLVRVDRFYFPLIESATRVPADCHGIAYICVHYRKGTAYSGLLSALEL
jgi:hypothetical protein